MSVRKDKSPEKLHKDAVKAAEKLRKAEIRMAEKLAKSEAGAANEPRMPQAQASGIQLQNKSARRAVRIDLLAEAKAERKRRRNDPVKRAVWIGGFCVSVMLLWVLKLQVDLNFGRSEYHRLTKLYSEIRVKHATLTNDLIQSAVVEHKLAALDRLTPNRFLWAPVLNALQTIMVKDIQVIRLTGDQKFVHEESRTIGAGSHKAVVPASMVERISLYIQARDVSSNEMSYLDYKDSLGDCNYFVRNLGRRHGFILEGVLKPPAHGQLDPDSQFTFFVLSSHFSEVRHSQ